MELNINNLSDFVKNATILWNKGLMSVPQVVRGSGLVKEVAIPNLTGNTREFSEIDLEEYASLKGESSQSSRAKVQQGYSKIGTLKRVSKDIGISYEMRNYGKYFEVKQKLTNLGKMGPNRLDLDLSHRFGFGTATTYVDMDGETVDISVGDTLALYSTAHTVRGSSDTFRNRLANNPQLSRGALESMEKMREENTINQFGEKMTIKDDILWVTSDPNTVNTAKELLRSRANPTQENPGVVNVYEDSYKLRVLPRVATDKDGKVDSTKAKYWGTASSEFSTLMLGMNEEARMKKPPVEGSNGEEFSTDDFNFGTRMGYMIVSVSANWLGFSSGDATA
jgi:hypothetical protein